MAFDPSKPASNTPNSSAEMRAQLNGLKALIDAISTVSAAQVDSTTSLPNGAAAQVTVSVTGNTLHFSFQIPEGAQGNDGPIGPQGPQGPMGEVSAAEVANAVSLGVQGTSNNSNAVGQMSLNVDPSYNQAQMQQISDKLDELILALRR